MDKLQLVFDWSEVWATLIPLLVLTFRKDQPSLLRPIIIYLWVALFLYLSGNIISDFKAYLPSWLQGNNFLYNVHSVVRFVCFSHFFFQLPQTSFRTIKRFIPVIFFLFVTINFSAFENFLDQNQLSGNLLTVEAFLLLIYCMLFYLSLLREEEDLTSSQEFWVVTGLSAYVVINFFVFLFYVPLLTQNVELAIQIWNVHNIAHIILCIFIAKALYEPIGSRLRV
ncbi:hypothetical protein [Rufibacter tibetensis]|uniref:Uncharacterized protein n=1 Tax=Rufibacter tibetensis TaxID=512763 RepID=A0A0P0C242_9BACT|nr:hypothetical protein [Rufibacter tibetensis]ALI98695.1 hypothetical protein DC20_06580 [Rufibacter tibetensis]